MRLLDYYLLRRYAFCLFLSILGLLLVSALIDLTENIDTFIDFHATLPQILRYYLYRAPYWIVLTLPIAALLGTLFTLTGLAIRREITAMKSIGISLYRLLAPILVSALLFSGLAFLFADRVMPGATYRYRTLRDEITSYSRTGGSRRQVLLQDRGGQMIFARAYDAERAQARDVSWERLEGSRLAERITARRLEWRGGRWIAFEGHRYLFGAAAPVRPAAFDTLSLSSLTLLPADFSRQQKRPEEMNYAELASYVERAAANGEDTTRYRVDLHLKISFPLTCFVIVLLGAPLGANARRAGLANSFGLGILICFVFYGCVKAGQALGWNGVLAPWAGAWMADIAFGLLGVILLWRAHK